MLAQLFFAGANIFYKMLCFDTFRLKWFKFFPNFRILTPKKANKKYIKQLIYKHL